ncbi:MAG: monoheme cytochrome C [Gilvibacter sp.]
MEESKKPLKEEFKLVYHTMVLLYAMVGIFAVVMVYLMIDPSLSGFKSSPEDSGYIANTLEEDDDKIEDGIHLRTGLIDAQGLMTVVNNCTNCHSAKLVTQNRMSAERWNATIRWMQETQNLWDLGGNQEIIVNYLVTNYPVQDIGRRATLTNIEWYDLED